MPCLNEALTIAQCVTAADRFLTTRGIEGEVLVADNGSSDGSPVLALEAGARVVEVPIRGYGSALIVGIREARGRYVAMADADGSYDFEELDAFIDLLRGGTQLVVGNRFAGLIKPGAMPKLNRYLGNPVLSYLGRKLFAPAIRDFHCGLRAFERDAILRLNLRASGMEFASEMVVKASLAELRMAEVPITLNPDGRDRASHLRPWRDGWRHLRFLLLRSPQWLFLYPGIFLATAGSVGAAALTLTPIRIGATLTLDINALLYSCITVMLGVQMIFFGLFAHSFARRLKSSTTAAGALLAARLPLKYIAAAGTVFAAAGLIGALYAIAVWGQASFGPLVPSTMMRLTIPSVTLLAIGIQMLLGSVLIGFIELD